VKTDLAAGSIVLMRERNRDQLYEIVEHDGENAYTGVARHLKRGDVVHKVAWKRGGDDELHVTGSFELREDAGWERIFPALPDTSQSEFDFQRQQAQTMAAGIAAMMGPDELGAGSLALDIGFLMTGLVVDGHEVLISPGQTSVRTGGASWSWLTPERQADGTFHGVGPSRDELSAWTFDDYVRYARTALAEYHRQHEDIEPTWFKCGVCHPSYHNVLKPGTLKKVQHR
jgi:hypothetical protein